MPRKSKEPGGGGTGPYTPSRWSTEMLDACATSFMLGVALGMAVAVLVVVLVP